MTSGRSGGVELPDLVPITRPICPSNSIFQSIIRKTKWSGGLFRLSHKDRTDSLL